MASENSRSKSVLFNGNKTKQQAGFATLFVLGVVLNIVVAAAAISHGPPEFTEEEQRISDTKYFYQNNLHKFPGFQFQHEVDKWSTNNNTFVRSYKNTVSARRGKFVEFAKRDMYGRIIKEEKVDMYAGQAFSVSQQGSFTATEK